MTTVNFSVKGADGVPIHRALIDITLTESGIEYLGEGIVLPTSVQASTDISGSCSVELAPVNTAPYVAVILDNEGKRKGVHTFYVPESESSVDVHDLIIYPKPSNINYDAAAIAAIIDAKVRAEAAAEMLENFSIPRYQVSDLNFTLVSSTQTAHLSLDNNNGLLLVTESEGEVIVPHSDTTNFEIGSALLFINSTSPEEVIDISFVAENSNVNIETIGLSPTLKLENPSDIIVLIKVADNDWKIANLTAGESGNVDGALLSINQSINNIILSIATLNSWRSAFNTQLNNQSTSIIAHTLNLADVNSSIASLTEALTTINSTIETRINEAIPGLGDLTGYVADAEDAAASAANALTTILGLETSVTTIAGDVQNNATLVADHLSSIEDMVDSLVEENFIISAVATSTANDPEITVTLPGGLSSNIVFIVENTAGANTGNMTFTVNGTTRPLYIDGVSEVPVGGFGNVGAKMIIQGSDDNSSFIVANSRSGNDVTTASLQAAIKAAFPYDSKEGLYYSPGTDTSRDFSISPGKVKDSTNTVLLELSSTQSKQTNVSWSAGNEGGAHTGAALAVNSWYPIFIVGDADGVGEIGIDSVLNATNLLNATGKTYYRHIGWFGTKRTSTHLRLFSHNGKDNYVYGEIQHELYTGVSTSWDDYEILAPPNSIASLIAQVRVVNNGTESFELRQTNGYGYHAVSASEHDNGAEQLAFSLKVDNESKISAKLSWISDHVFPSLRVTGFQFILS